MLAKRTPARVLDIVRKSRIALSRMQRLHFASVTIGRLERIADTGVCDGEIKECRAIIERCDTTLAEIDRFLVDETLECQHGSHKTPEVVEMRRDHVR